MNNIVLITGASGGIGREIALRFVENGFPVVLMYHTNKSSLDELIKRFPANAQYLIIGCDLCNFSETQSVVNTIHEQFGSISILVNNAGIALPQMLFSDTTDDQMMQIFQTNVYSQMHLTRLLLDDIRQSNGSVINISSMWGISGASCEVLYSASKAAVIGFTKALAKEMGPSHVRVNCIAPGYITTPMNSHLSSESIEQFRLSTPLEKLGHPKDIADAVYYLAHADYITGQIISVDGGVII